MIKKKILFLLCIIFPLIINSQEILTTNGGFMSNNNINANWTIGELITETITNDAIVTSGFNQPVMTIVSVIEIIRPKFEISFYPNPTSETLNLKYKGQLPFNMKIISVNGMVIYNTQINEPISEFDFSSQKKGIYLIEITEQTGKSNIYRITKQ